MESQTISPTPISWQQRYLQKFYGSRPHWIDGTSEFHAVIAKHVAREASVLELGPGPGGATSNFLARTFRSVHGLDVDEDARQNPALRQVHIYQGQRWPLADHSYDAVVADFVLEHLADPRLTVAETFRVLQPGGVFLFRTPNLWHYVSLVSRLSPHWFHRLVANPLRKLAAGHHEPYPTYYRMNRLRTVRDIALEAGFREAELYTIEKEPSYGMACRPLFLLFMAYERTVNCSSLFRGLRANILGTFQKPLTDSHPASKVETVPSPFSFTPEARRM